ncbi:uncharacterized protein LOC126577780 [Anopheles aquasalis]|uniref:uncharacterized protein LOC126577780 n=1 Tax=Anopheles aquasalis TaxID=42839 RepID=UPI00215A2F87|nr:uncharacterized protein LOC126577780 [Anopheles aquasalis]
MQINKTEQAATTMTELGGRIQVGPSVPAATVAAAAAGPSALATTVVDAPTDTDSLAAQEQQQWGIMQLFSISEVTQASLVYCQRALRDFVKLHQVVAYQIDKLPPKKVFQAKQYLIDLEDEIRSIGKEQEGMVAEVTEKLREFQQFILLSRGINIPNELADGYVSNTFQRYYETCGSHVSPPPGLTLRRNVAEIAEHYSIEAILNLYDEECIERTPQSRSLLKKRRKQGPQPLLVASSRSLLKPPTGESKTEGAETETTSSTVVAARLATKERRAFANIGKPPIKAQEVADAEDHFPADVAIKVEPEIIIEVEQQQPQPQPQWPLPGKAWKPGFRGRPPKVAKELGLQKTAVNDRELKPSVKDEPEDIEEAEAEEQEGQEAQEAQEQEPWVPTNDSSNEAPPPPPTTAAYRRGRTNLLQALNKTRQVNTNVDLPSTSTAQSGTVASSIPPSSSQHQKGKKRSRGAGTGGKLAKHPSTGTATSSGSSPNSRCSTPSSGGDSSDPRSSIGEFPAIGSEPPVPTPLSIFELGQPPYLRFFGLVTHEEAKALKESKAVRKRRSCNSTERKDFHYGRLDYYEQQLYQQASVAAVTAATSGPGKRRVGCSKRPVLYSPQVVARKRKQAAAAAAPLPASTSSCTTSGSSSSINSNSSPEGTTLENMLTELGEKCCFVCNEKGSVAELSSCTNCCNIYHIECHEGANELKEELCPVCLTD